MRAIRKNTPMAAGMATLGSGAEIVHTTSAAASPAAITRKLANKAIALLRSLRDRLLNAFVSQIRDSHIVI
jgi:hypothetical protein